MALKMVALFLGLIIVMASDGSANRGIRMGLKAAEDEGESGLAECWNVLVELKSCSSEIIGSLVNRETEIGAECCRAIDITTHNCWPAMLSSIGITAEEGNILRGYCDASADADAPSPPPSTTPTPSPTSSATPAPSPSPSPSSTIVKFLA